MPKIVIEGEIGWDTTSREVKNQLKNMRGDLEVEISSVGGSIYQGIEIFNALEKYEGHITTINIGMAASMASYLMLVGDSIKAYDNATYMIHNGSTFAWGDHNKLRKTADHVEQLSALICKKYMEKTGKSEAELRTMMDDETFLYGDEMLEHGFVDEMISTDKNKDKSSALASFQASISACAADAKAHYKEDGYSGNLEEALASMPTEPLADEIVKNSNERGDDMPKAITQDDLDAVQAKHDAATATISSLNDTVASLTSKLDGATASVNELKEAAAAQVDLTQNIVAMSYEHSVDKETAIKMVGCASLGDAGILALGTKPSDGVLETADLGEDDEAASAEAEMVYAAAVAKSLSIKK